MAPGGRRRYGSEVTSPTPQSQSERRRATRAAANFPVKLSSDAVAEPARMRDISEIGLACIASEPIEEMTLVGIDFSLPGASEMHHGALDVVRCDRMADEGGKRRWDIAIYFTEIKPVTRAALHNYVAKGKPV